MLPDWLPWLLQVNDSQFPSGAYAHSLGLEDLVQRGLVRDADGLRAFLRDQVGPALLAFDVPMLARAHAAAAAGELPALAALDRELDAWKLAEELRQASRRMGSRRLALVRRLAPAPVLDEFAALETPQHLLVVAALEMRALPVAVAAWAMAHQTVTGYVTAAVKLLRLGQDRAQAVLRDSLAELAPGVAAAAAAPPTGDPGWFNPLLEIASLRHARARERLFIS
jgi:urease accessory protein